MGLFINTNLKSINAMRQLDTSTRALSRSFERLSSGLRINSARDDSAGLSISTRFTAQIKGFNQAIRNSNDGISLAQTAEGALNETTNILQRIRELSVQSANDTNNSADRAALQAEVGQLVSELDRIANTANFNGSHILNGDFINKHLQVGANAGEQLTFSLGGAKTDQLARQARYEAESFVSVSALGGASGLTISSVSGSFSIRETVKVDDALSTTLHSSSAIAKAAAINDSFASTGVRALVGPTVLTGSSLSGVFDTTLDEQNYLTINEQKISGFQVESNDASGALVDAINSVYDKTGVTANINARGVLVLTAEDGRNIDLSFSDPFSAINLGFDTAGGVVEAATISVGGDRFVATGKITLQSNELFEVYGDSAVIGFANAGIYGVNSEHSVSTINVSSKEGAVKALDVVDLALEHVSFQRAQLGALQSKLESTISNLSTTSENLSASRSRILDADFATETAALSRNQIIQQAGVSILSQANQSSQIVLSLLG